jgi:hypothetical protein
MLHKIKMYIFVIHIIGSNVMLDASQIFRFIIIGESACMYGWLQKKRELSEKVLSDFIKFL